MVSGPPDEPFATHVWSDGHTEKSWRQRRTSAYDLPIATFIRTVQEPRRGHLVRSDVVLTVENETTPINALLLDHLIAALVQARADVVDLQDHLGLPPGTNHLDTTTWTKLD